MQARSAGLPVLYLLVAIAVAVQVVSVVTRPHRSDQLTTVEATIAHRVQTLTTQTQTQTMQHKQCRYY